VSRRKTPEPTPVSSRVEILLGTHQVVVEAAETLADTVGAALKLWRDTADAAAAGEALGFTAPAIISDPIEQLLMGPEVSLPYQLISAQETPDDRII
jgi:hypothetical protein